MTIIPVKPPQRTKRTPVPPRTCCPSHTDRCRFGRPHFWTTWFENGQLVRTSDTYHCPHCSGVCTAEEEEVAAMELIDDYAGRAVEELQYGDGEAAITRAQVWALLAVAAALEKISLPENRRYV